MSTVDTPRGAQSLPSGSGAWHDMVADECIWRLRVERQLRSTMRRQRHTLDAPALQGCRRGQKPILIPATTRSTIRLFGPSGGLRYARPLQGQWSSCHFGRSTTAGACSLGVKPCDLGRSTRSFFPSDKSAVDVNNV